VRREVRVMGLLMNTEAAVEEGYISGGVPLHRSGVGEFVGRILPCDAESSEMLHRHLRTA